MIVFDPVDDRVLVDPPRDLAGFVRAFARGIEHTKGRAPNAGATPAHHALRDLTAPDERPLPDRLADPNPIARAIALEELDVAKDIPAATLDEVQAILADADEDVVVYLRALRVCAKRRPDAVLSRARELLAIDNDPLRYAVLELVQAHPEPALAGRPGTRGFSRSAAGRFGGVLFCPSAGAPARKSARSATTTRITERLLWIGRPLPP
jgi:hypothetical protein